MPKLRAHNISVSLDGYAAGPDQSLDNPLGVGGQRVHEWVFATRAFRQVHGLDPADGEGGEGGGESNPIDEAFITAGDAGIGATIMGRNMFGPIRGPWPDAQEPGEEWKGWWGDNPPYHHPVFVLTHYPRASFTMDGGTTFHFVTDGIEAALGRAFEAADGADVRLGGGVATIQAYLRAGLLDELHVAIAPVLLGGGERLFDRLDGGAAGYSCVELIGSGSVAHARIARAGDSAAATS